MSKLRAELSIIPSWARIVAVGLALALAIGAPTAIELSDANAPPIPVSIAFGLFMGAMLGAFILLIGYVNGDAKRRGMRSTVWTLIALFVPNGLGILLYFLLRDPLRSPCPSCGQLVQPTFNFCPKCHRALKPVCQACGKAVSKEHAYCPYCGTEVKAAATPPA